MGKFICECGNVISDTTMPCKELNFLLDSYTYFDTPGDVANNKEYPELWECPKCLGLTRFDGSPYRTCYYMRLEEKQ